MTASLYCLLVGCASTSNTTRHPDDFLLADVSGTTANLIPVRLIVRTHPLRWQTAEQKAQDQRECAERVNTPTTRALTSAPSHSIIGTAVISMLLSGFERCMTERGYEVEQPPEYSARPSNQ